MKGPVSLGVDIATKVLEMKDWEGGSACCSKLNAANVYGSWSNGRSPGDGGYDEHAAPRGGFCPVESVQETALEDAETVLDSLFSLKKSSVPNASEAETDRMDDADLIEAERLLDAGIQARHYVLADVSLDHLQAARVIFSIPMETGMGKVGLRPNWDFITNKDAQNWPLSVQTACLPS